MKTRALSLWVFSLLLTSVIAAMGVDDHDVLPNLDRRLDDLRPPATLDATRASAAARLRTRIPAVRIELADVLASPVWVYSTHGFLTGPYGEGEIMPRTAQTRPSIQGEDPH